MPLQIYHILIIHGHIKLFYFIFLPAESKLLKMGISYKFERTENDVCRQMLIHKVSANIV